jgi:hypothetical protein
MKHIIPSEFYPIRVISGFVIVFWAVWTGLVLVSDIINWLQVVGWCAPETYYSSHNFDLITKSFAPFTHNANILLSAFGVVILSYFINTILFLLAIFYIFDQARFSWLAWWALFLGVFSESAFVLIDEITLQYALEQGHMDRLALRFITIGIFYLFNHVHKNGASEQVCQ